MSVMEMDSLSVYLIIYTCDNIILDLKLDHKTHVSRLLKRKKLKIKLRKEEREENCHSGGS